MKTCERIPDGHSPESVTVGKDVQYRQIAVLWWRLLKAI